MTKIFYEIMAALLTVGGVGIINYMIAEQLSAIDTTQNGSNREKALALVFTMFDYFLYLVMKFLWGFCLKGIPLLIATCVSTALISLVISFCGSKWINDKFYDLINFVRGKNNMSFRRSATNWQSAFNLNGAPGQLVYLYDFNHKPLGWGWRKGISNDKESNYSISIMPQPDDDPEGHDSYEEVAKFVQQENFQKDYDVTQYINFQQKFIAIICNVKS